MPEINSSALEGSGKRTRKTQERTEVTRAKLVDAGILLFCERGFDAVSVRDLETTAGVKRNLLAYHFGDKETLWKVSTDTIYLELKKELDKRISMIKEISGREILAVIIKCIVYFTANNPKISLLVSHEAMFHSWRTEYLIEQHIRPGIDTLEKLMTDTTGLEHDAFIHWYYIMITSTACIFVYSPHCEALFGVDPCEESMVEAHAEMVVSMLLKGAQIE